MGPTPVVNVMFYSLLAVAFTVLIGSVSIRAWWIERKKRLIAEHGVIERPNSSHASKAVRNQEDEEWWRRIDLERLHELNREYVERLLRQIEGAGVGALTKDERAFMERMAELEAPPHSGAPAPTHPRLRPA